MRSAIFLAVLCFASFGEVTAQDPSLQSGQRVRVTAPGIDRQAAVFNALDGDVLTVTADSTLQYRLADVTRLEVSRGTRSNAGKGAVIGGAITGGVGLGLTVAFVAGGCIDGCKGGGSVVLGTMLLTAIFALPGAGIGALIGAGSTHERWEEIPRDRLTVSVGPTARGVGIRASIAF